MYYTYILLCADNLFYTGYTPDLRNRFKQHKLGKVISTKKRLPVELVYYEACINKEDALRREKTLKSGPGKTYLKKRLKRFLTSIRAEGPSQGTP